MQGKIDIPKGLQTRLCVLGADMLKEVPATFRSLWPDGTAIIVADENTWRAAGQSVADFLRETGIPQDEPVIFPAEPRLHADDRHAQNLRERIAGKVAIAVGGGTGFPSLCGQNSGQTVSRFATPGPQTVRCTSRTYCTGAWLMFSSSIASARMSESSF